MNTGVKRRNKRATTDALLPVVGGWGVGRKATGVGTQHRVLGCPVPSLGRGLGVEGSSQSE